MFFIRQTALFIALLSQLVLCAVPARKYQDGYLYVDLQPEDGIGGIYPGLGDGMSYADIGNLAIAATEDAITAAIQHDVLIPKGVSVYINGNRDLVIGAIGAGTGNHGEQNVKIFCEENRLEFDSGKMVTYVPSEGGFIRACGTSGEDARDCIALLIHYNIADVRGAVKAAIEAQEARRDVADKVAVAFDG